MQGMKQRVISSSVRCSARAVLVLALPCWLACGHGAATQASGSTQATAASAPAAAAAESGRLEVAVDTGDLQATGVAVSARGRLFGNFPRWSERVRTSVAEYRNGRVVPFPNEALNGWDGKKDTDVSHFVCVQSVVVDAKDHLWILDPASPLMGGVVPGAAKLVEVDLASDTIGRTIHFGPDIAKPKSYLNDVRFDREGRFAYITDSGLGAIVVVDLASGTSRRLLEGHPSTKPEKETFSANGHPLILPDGSPAQVASDGIALDPTGTWLYWHALTGRALYRARTADLRDASLSPEALGARVVQVAKTHAPDGMEFDARGRLYLTDIEDNAVVRIDVDQPGMPQQVVVRSPQLDWPDSMAFGPDGALYVTASQIEKAPRFNQGQDRRTEPYRTFRIPGVASAK